MKKNQVRDIFLYGGVSKEEYNQIKPLIQNENQKIWKFLSVFLEVVFAGLFALALFEPSHNKYIIGYGLLAGSMIIFCLLIAIFVKSHSKAVLPIIYTAIMIMLGVFIYIGVFVEIDRPTVVFSVLVVGLPLVTIDRPLRSVSLSVITLAAYLILVSIFKQGFATKLTDILDGSIFAVIGMALATFISSVRTRDILVRFNAEVDRDTDALTSVSNKLAYDRRVDEISNLMQEGNIKFALAIFDVNNLKATNDTYGHEQGDKLLINCCNLIREALPNTDIYRIGGDEFAAIITDVDYQNRERLLRELYERINNIHEHAKTLKDDTSLALGVAVYNAKQDHDFMAVFSRADAQMYDHKKLLKRKNKYELD